jgi:O-antigen ligase
MKKLPFDWRVFAVAVFATSIMPVKAMGWSLTHYVVKPWLSFYQEALSAVPWVNELLPKK